MIWRVFAAVLLKTRATFWWVVYRAYRSRYAIHPRFRFNGAGIQLYGEGEIELWADSYIGEWSTMQAAQGLRVRVGRHCRLSHNLRIYTETAHADADFRVGPAPALSGSVEIGDGVWIGTNCYIGPGITIGDNAVVGANSVVTCDVPAHEIWGGVPARLIRRKRVEATRESDAT